MNTDGALLTLGTHLVPGTLAGNVGDCNYMKVVECALPHDYTIFSVGPWRTECNVRKRATEGGAMQKRYRLKTSIPALYDKPGGRVLRVTLPAGAMLTESSQHSSTLLGLVGVYWESRHYSVALNDLLYKSVRVQSA